MTYRYFPWTRALPFALVAIGLSITPAAAHGGHHWHGGGWGWGPWPTIGLGFLGGYLLSEHLSRRPVEVMGPSRAYSPVSECAYKYKSFDPSTGTFMSLDGTRKVCPYLK